MNIYIVERADSFDYDEYVEQTVVAKNEESALAMASKEYGEWQIQRIVDLSMEQVLTKDFNAG